MEVAREFRRVNVTAYRKTRPLWHFAHQFLDVLTPRGRWMLCISSSGLLYIAFLLSTVATNAVVWIAVVLAGSLGLGLMWLAAQPTPPDWIAARWDRVPGVIRWRGWRALIVAFLIVTTWMSFRDQWRPLAEGQYRNDAIAYVHMDADLLARGRNPYTADDAFWEAAQRWPLSLATPLLGSQRFGANARHYPSGPHIASILQYEAANAKYRDAAFDPSTVHNYPAGIIWLAVPFTFAGLPSVIWLNFLALLLMILLITWQAPSRLRGTVLVTLIANPIIPMFTLFMNFDVVCFVFILMAWQSMRHEKSSALLLGFACAIKQVAWFFAPFYLIEVWRREGWQAALRRTGFMATGFLVPNLPFIIASPKAWFHSMLIPMADSMYPLGFGPAQLMLGGPLPVLPARLWTALEIAVWVGMMIFQFMRPRITADGALISPLPLWFSWRSPLNYFALMPMMATWLAIKAEAAKYETQVFAWPEVTVEQTAESDTLTPDLPERQLAGVS